MISSLIFLVPASTSAAFPTSAAGSWKLQFSLMHTPGKDRTPFGGFLVTHCDHVVEYPPLPEQVEDAPGRTPRDIDAILSHRLDYDRIEPVGFQSGAFDLEHLLAQLLQVCFGHPAAAGIPGTQYQDSFFHFSHFFISSTNETHITRGRESSIETKNPQKNFRGGQESGVSQFECPDEIPHSPGRCDSSSMAETGAESQPENHIN